MWWLLLILPLSYATPCHTGHQFWNETLGKCVVCTKCTEPGDLVLRPCQIHQDTVCGPLSSLDIDWTFMRRSHKHSRRPPQSGVRNKQDSSVEASQHFVTNNTNVFSSTELDKKNNKKPHNKKSSHRGKHHHKTHHVHHKKKSNHHHKIEWSSETFPDSTNSSEFEDVFGWSSSSMEHHEVSFSSRKSNHSHHHRNSSKSHRHRPESASQLKELESVANLTELQTLESHRTATPAPFSATEELVWDWQAVALGLAVFACVFFFLVACVYSVHHARQWRRLKDHFDDFEAGK